MITINNFQKGQASSPYLADGAFAMSKSIDIHTQPGILRSNFLPTLAGTPGHLLTSYAVDNASVLYMAGNDYIYTVDYDNATPAITSIKGTAPNDVDALGVAVWEGYLLGQELAKIRYAALATPSVWGDFDATTPTTLTSLVEHNIFNSVWDGSLYVTNGQYIAKLSLVSGATFDPTSDATYSFADDAFKLPKGYFAMGISEIDNMLVIAAKFAVTTATGKYKTVFFFWDRTSTTAEYIYEIDEAGIFNLFKKGRKVYAAGGIYCNIYEIGLFGVNLWKKIPFDFGYWRPPYTIGGGNGSRPMSTWNGNLVIGIGHLNSAGDFNPCGIYTVTDNSISHSYNPSSGDYGSDNTLEIGVIAPMDDYLLYSWRKTGDSTVNGLDIVKTSNYRTITYASYFETLMYPVGLYNDKNSFDRVEVQLARGLEDGDGIKIEYRTKVDPTNATWTTLGTQTYTTNGAASSLTFPGIHNIENIQLKISLTSKSPSRSSAWIKEVYLI